MTSLRHKIGQMLIMGFEGTSIHAESPIKKWLSEDGLGGVILFDKDLASQKPGKNIESRQQIQSLNRDLQICAEQNHSANQDKLPLFIAIDYEGGAVDRLQNVPDCMPTIKPAEIAKLAEPERMALFASMADTLKDLGFNLNFAPLLDLNLNAEAGIIGKLGRCFSAEPQEVIRIAREFVRVFSDKGIGYCYKHFPGHGSAASDSHEGFVDVSHTFQYIELEPYQVLLAQQQKSAMVMTAHVINRELDASGLPATLSEDMLNGLLREKIGFDGVIISDDMQMKAIADHFTMEEALCLSINAGADMLIFGNQLGHISATELIDRIERIVNLGQIPESRIDESYQRIVALKNALKRA